MKKYLKTKGKEFKLTTLGFTLIELLAVIIILSIIALITVPVIMNIIERQLKGIALLGFLYPKNRKIFGNSKPYKLE